MSKILLITNSLQSKPTGGREMLCKLNYKLLLNLYQKNLHVIELEKKEFSNTKSKISSVLNGYIDGVDSLSILRSINLIKKKRIKKIFIDGSNLGAIVASIKKHCSKVEIITFFHNVETRFFLGALRSYPTIKSLGVLIANYIAESKSVKYSDELVCLSQRDSNLLQKLYKRGASKIAPISLEDKYIYHKYKPEEEKDGSYALFVGGAFYANHLGIKWFAKNVAPFINIKIYVIGSGFNQYKKEELETSKNIKVIGKVQDLSKWYLNAKFVIAPIFDGSGMKTKVAESLMHGKRLIGTKEAFTGYEEINEQIGWTCNNAEEFISTINYVSKILKNNFDQDLRKIYLEKYSFEAALNRMKIITNFSKSV